MDEDELVKEIERAVIKQYRKKMRLLKVVFISALIYFTSVFALAVASVFFEKSYAILQLLLYIGNVFGLGCSIYVIRSWWRMRVWWFLLLGIFLAGLNGYYLLEFLM